MEGLGPQRRYLCALGAGLIALSAPVSSVAEKRTGGDTDAVAAAACTETVERFVQDLDGLMAENPRSLDRYRALLGWYFAPRGGSSTAPNWSITGCDTDQLIPIMKRSKFLYETGSPLPHYQYSRFEFRNKLVKVYFAIESSTGTIVGAGAWWVQPYP